LIDTINGTGDTITISDCRFPNEYNEINKIRCQVYNIKVIRDGCSADGHSSEAHVGNFDIDFLIENNETLEDLKTKVTNLVKDTYGII
jgi:hypothetical protein